MAPEPEDIPEPEVPKSDAPDAQRSRERPADGQQADRKYHIDEADYKDVPTLDGDGNPVLGPDGSPETTRVYRIVADRDIVNDAGEVVCAAGGRGGYVAFEVEPGQEGEPDAGGGLKGLSQLDDCWISDDAVLMGDASVTKDAQMHGRSVLYGDATLTENAAMGGNAKACGKAVLDGQAVVTDDALVTDGAHIGGDGQVFDSARVGGRADVADGKEADGSWAPSLVGGSAELSGGVRVAGGTVLGESRLSGEVLVGPGAIVAGDGDGVELGGRLELGGTVTVTGTQRLSPEEPLAIMDDDAFDAAAAGRSLEGATGPDQSGYLRAAAEHLAHEMGENRADTPFQAQGTAESREEDHGTVVDGMYRSMMDAFRGAEEGTTRAAFDQAHPVQSAYHDGLNDAVAEDRAEAAADGPDALEGYRESATAKRWAEGSQERAGAQKESMRSQVSGRSEWKHGGTGLARNPDARRMPDTSGVKKAGPDDGLGIV